MKRSLVDWTDATLATLRELWIEGLPAAEIGRRICATKNAVIAKAHRIGMPGRESPIGRACHKGDKRPTVARAPRVTLPSVASVPPPASPPVVMAPPPTPLPTRPPVRCCWPIGDPRSPRFRFCEAEAVPARPYCPEHFETAYGRRSAA